MSHPLEYVITGALLQCSQGTAPMPFRATPRTTKIAGLLAGNALDKLPLVNIPSFVVCKKLTQLAGGTPTPCVPAPLLWQDTYPAKIGGADALLFRSCITCPVGQGKIEFLTSGQLPLPPAVSQDLKELKQEAEASLEQEPATDAVGEASFAEGLIPIWGSGRDFINAAQTGDKVGMALNGAFLVWDAVSVVAGVFSFGTATAGMMAGKAGLRAALKAGSKVALSAAARKLAATVAKAAALKKGLPAALKAFAKKVPRVCVTACFPAGTPIAVPDGFKNIEDIRVGDLVWSWNEETDDLALKSVLQTMQHEVQELIELRIGAETIRTTPEHPFVVDGAWLNAGHIAKGQTLLRSDGQNVPVAEVVQYSTIGTTVYNFEVSDWHTYLVGWWMFIVHNVCDNNIIKLITRNARLAGKKHAKTGVEFIAKTIEYGGKKITGVFPKFDAAFKMKLPKRLHQASDYEQFTSSTKFLREQIKKNPDLAKKFSPGQLEDIAKGKDKVRDYTWHHNEDVGVMELVPQGVHGKTGHTGGKIIWGGGAANR